MFVEIIGTKILKQYAHTNDYFYQLVLDIQKNNKNADVSTWRCDTFCTERFYDLANDLVFKDILGDIKQAVKVFALEYGVSQSKPIMTSGWINLTPPGDYQEYHIHTNNHFSIVYYVKTPKNSGNIVFRSHAADKDMFQLPASTNTEANFKTYYMEPVENKLLIFRSNLAHMVEKNKSDSDRVSISCNFYMQTK